MQMPEVIDPFASVRTSDVFFQLVLGRTTPKEIASSLETKPPSVVEHLHKLRGMGIVKLGEKKGKYQHYRIDWRKFAVVFFDHVYTPQVQEAALRLWKENLREEMERERRLLKEVIGELRRSEHFRALLQGYFKGLAEDMDLGLYPRRTVWGAIYCFEDALDCVPSLKKRIKDPELRKLLILLEKWNGCVQRFKWHGPGAAFVRSIGAAEKQR